MQQSQTILAREARGDRHFFMAMLCYSKALADMKDAVGSLEGVVEHMEGNGGWGSVLAPADGGAHEDRKDR